MTPVNCEALPAGTLSVEQAQAQILEPLQALQDEQQLPLLQGRGRILASDIHAPRAVPPHRNASMDGYACASQPVQHSALRQIGVAYAGRPFTGQVGLGECVRIMTGAVVPEGTDSVVMQENTQTDARDPHLIHVLHWPRHGEHVRHPGEDLALGSTVLSAGRRLTAADLGLLASLGIGEVRVLRRPRVAFFSTGDELQPLGSTLQPGELYDSNRTTLAALLAALDVECLDLGIVRDRPEAVQHAFQTASRLADVLISSGGVSVGDADYVTATLRQLGTVQFWKLAMKPGKPLAHGRLGNCLFFGLPGNPVSVMATFLLFVRPALLKLRGETVNLPPEYPALSSSALFKAPGRKEYQRGICSQQADGSWSVRSTGSQESHVLRSMSEANCFIVLERDCGDLPAGSPVRILPFQGLL